MEASFYWLVTVQGVVLRTSSVILFDHHKKRPEECLSQDLLGRAAVTTPREMTPWSQHASAISAQGWVPEGLWHRGCVGFSLCTPGPHEPVSAHISLVRTGHVSPSSCRWSGGEPSVHWEGWAGGGGTRNWCIMTMALIGPLYRW